MRTICQSCVLLLVTATCVYTHSSGIAMADESLQATLEDTAVDGRWIYNDWSAAQARAAKENKPILAMFR